MGLLGSAKALRYGLWY